MKKKRYDIFVCATTDLCGEISPRLLPLLKDLLHVLPGEVKVLLGVEEQLWPVRSGRVLAEEVPGPETVHVADIGGEAAEAAKVVRPHALGCALLEKKGIVIHSHF